MGWVFARDGVESHAAAAAEENKRGHMVACELEAAEALAVLARCSTLRGGGAELKRQHVTEKVVTSTSKSQDQPIAAEKVCEYRPSMVAGPEMTQKIVENIPVQLCSTSYQSNPVNKLRPKLTEAEKEERKLRRVLANRESARQTIRRRQAMHLELTQKAADALEQNEKLKKEKELAVEEYNYLKGRNEFLKAMLAEIKKGEVGEMEEEPKISEAEISCLSNYSTPPRFFHNQPSTVPCFWPSMVLPSDVFQFQCAAHSQFPPLQGDIPGSHQGRDNSMANGTPGAPLFVFPVPWLLPFLPHSSTLHSNYGTAHQCSKCSCLVNPPHEDNNEREASNSTKTMNMDSFQSTWPQDDGVGPSRSCQVDNTADVNVVPTHESMRHCLSRRNHDPIICPHKKPEEAFAAMEARRRRKELMKLRNVHCHNVQTRY